MNETIEMITDTEVKDAFSQVWRDLREVITRQLQAMKTGETGLSANDVTAVAGFLELCKAMAAERNVRLSIEPYVMPKFDDVDEPWED